MKQSIIFLLTLFTFCSYGQNKDKYDIIVDSLSRTGKSDQLIPYLQKELKSQPKNESILRWLGYLFIQNNQPDTGEKYYREALVVNPQCARCYLNIGRAYVLKKDNKKAFDFFDKSISMDPNDASLYAARATLKEMTGDKFGALFDFNKAVGLDPANADYYIQRGLYNANMGYYSIALSDMDKAVQLAPKNYYPYFERSSIYYDQQLLKEALADITTAIQLDSTQYTLYNGRGAIYESLKEPEKATADYTKAIALNPQGYLAYYNRSLGKYASEDMDGACADIFESYSLLTKYEPDNSLRKELELSISNFCDSTKASYYYQRGIAYYNLQQYEKAIAVYSRGLKKFPDNSMTLSFRGNAYYALGDFKNALPDYDAAIRNQANVIADVKNNPAYYHASADSVTLYVNGFLASMQLSIAEAKFALDDYDDALIAINKGLETAPDIKDFGKEEYYNVRGNILMALGKYDQAISDFDKCIIQLNPAFDLAYVNRAIAKVNLVDLGKITPGTIRGGMADQEFNANWKLPVKAAVKRPDAVFLSAIDDCNKAISINSKSAYAYYIRGQLKKMISEDDYCYDLLNAKQLGYPVEPELLTGCK